MSFDWKEFLRVAEAMQGSTDEASLRSAVSRAYYAALHVSRRYLERVERGFHVGTGDDTHSKVWDTLKKRPQSMEMSAGTLGDRLKRARKIADYDGSKQMQMRDAKAAVEDAKSLITKIEALPKPSVH